MAGINDPTTFGRAHLSFANEAEIDEFTATLDKFERGELTPDQWRAFRLVRGTYGQRQDDDAQMLRVKLPQGVASHEQLNALAEVADRYSRGFGHITTRQNLQFHFMKLRDIDPAMRLMADVGITTREACGNSVRNITACPYAGVAEHELFDVTPYGEALTRFLLRHPLAAVLPRKFKIAFEGCPDDHAVTAIHDIGWRARIQDGRRGFQVLVAGGTAILCHSGASLYEFMPVEEMFNVTEAILRVYHRLGDYKHKQRNRLKFLLRSLGWERFKAEVDAALDEVKREGGKPLPFDPEHPPVEQAPAWSRPPAPSLESIAARVLAARLRGPGIHPETSPDLAIDEALFARWRQTNLRRQKQPGYVSVTVTVPLGDLTGAQLRVLADLARSYADGDARVTVGQNLVLRWVPEADVRALYQGLSAAGLGRANADTIADVTSCPGAESCRLAVTQSRGLGSTLVQYLRQRTDLIDKGKGINIKISGCPNGCGQHHIAGIGFQGALRKVGAKAAPQYFVLVGGGTAGTAASFGRVAAKIPARRVPAALERLVGLYADERTGDETAETFFRRIEPGRVKALLADLEALTPDTATTDDFIDFAETKEFAPEMLDGECSA